MIRVVRPGRVPRVLTGSGVKYRQSLCEQHDAAPAEYRSCRLTFTFNSRCYGAKSIKSALLRAQHGKCAFCESKVSHVAYGDIEHFRPKAGYQQRATDGLQRPGYYWLAYEWTNLLFACQICNQQGKKNLFPLANPRRRATSHHDDLSAERPLLIDPADHDPERYIGFREEVAYPRHGRRIGKRTIEILALNRPALLERRRDRLKMLQLLQQLREALRGCVKESETPSNDPLRAKLREIDVELQRATDDRAEHAAMARCALTKRG